MNALVDHLASYGDRLAVATPTEQLSYRALAARVADAAAELGARRRLVLLRTRNELGTLVPYLGALAGCHVVLPVPHDSDAGAVTRTYRPDAVIARDGSVVEIGEPAGERLHRDLALLLSTSGSTGSPKLVRLSRGNLLANAEAIAHYLHINERDRAATTLPMSYCYGLSVIHSSLLRGAGLILTDHSVVDEEFWEHFRCHGGTSFAGVPYTFDLLDRSGFADRDLPRLRYVTQAGGRLPPERVRAFAELGARRGWQLFVMYGATEATARMAYLPPDLASTHPQSIGRPIPGGSFTIEPLDGTTEPGVGELVYRGPNVMLGYAESRADLGLGRAIEALRTGDIASRDADGLYEVIGRRYRFVKLYGLRIDLQRVETLLGAAGVAAICTDADDRLVVGTVGAPEPAAVRRLTAEVAGVPADAIAVVTLSELPVLPSGKPDYQAVRAAAFDATVATAPAADGHAGDVRRLFADVLPVDPDQIEPDQTFLDLGGTSLNYVAMTIRLERMLGRLPTDWQRLPVGRIEQLACAGRRPRRWFSSTLETSVALRAAAIVLIVCSHSGLLELWGGAHILLGIAGFNFGRFSLTPATRGRRIRQLRSTVAWIAVPSIVWVAVALLLTDDYRWTNLLLANKILGPFDSMTAGRLWFVEVLVYTLLALMLVCSVPVIDRVERRYPFTFAMVFLAAGVALRYDIFGFHQGSQASFTYLAFWFFAAGWAAAKARSTWQRAAVTAVMVVCIAGYFGDGLREGTVLAGFVLLIWLPALRCPTPIPLLAGLLAEASLYTYLTHFQVYPLLDDHPLLGVTAALSTGVVLTTVSTAARARWRQRAYRRRRSAAAPILGIGSPPTALSRPDHHPIASYGP